MSNRKPSLFVAATLACGLYSALADQPEDIIVPAPLPVFVGSPEPAVTLTTREGAVLHLAQGEPAAPKPVPAPPKRSRGSGGGDAFAFSFAGSTPTRSLVIPRDDMDPQTLAGTQEDLNVMAVILDEALDHKSGDDRKVLGIDILSGSSSGARNLFLEGYGAIFIVKTKLTLTPPPVEKKEDASAKEPENSEWEEARRRLYGAPEWEREIHRSLKHLPGGPAMPYDEDKVTKLKNDVIDSLRNATNIRGLKGDNTVTVVIQGSGGDSGPDMFTTRLHAIVRGAVAPEAERGGIYVRDEKTGEVRRGSTMVIQAKKSDIDDFNKNGNKEAFRKKVKVRVQ